MTKSISDKNYHFIVSNGATPFARYVVTQWHRDLNYSKKVRVKIADYADDAARETAFQLYWHPQNNLSDPENRVLFVLAGLLVLVGWVTPLINLFLTTN